VVLADPHNPGESLWRALIGGWRRGEEEATVKAKALLESLGLEHMADEYAGSLSGGQRKLLERARAMMVAMEWIMLDEPIAGINSTLRQQQLTRITGLRDEGKTVVDGEDDMDVVQEISDGVVVLAEGQVIAEGAPSSIAGNPDVIEAYLGAHRGKAVEDE